MRCGGGQHGRVGDLRILRLIVLVVLIEEGRGSRAVADGGVRRELTVDEGAWRYVPEIVALGHLLRGKPMLKQFHMRLWRIVNGNRVPRESGRRGPINTWPS